MWVLVNLRGLIMVPLTITGYEYTTFTVLSSVTAAASGLLVGYELGIISGALLQLHTLLELTCQQQEMVVSALLIGALLASLTGGFLIDQYGRKIIIIMTSCLFIVGSFILVFSTSYIVLIVGRLVIGISIPLSISATCIYIAEIAPQHKRGQLVSLNELMIIVGILLAYIVNYLFANVSNGWQYMSGLVILPAILQAIAMYFLPPSPRFLIMTDCNESACKVLRRLRSTSDIDQELNSIESSLKKDKRYTFFDLFTSKDNMRARGLIAILLVFFMQITGQPNIIFYASTILKSVGFQSNAAATLASTGVGIAKVVGTIPAILFVDNVGSKIFLCIGSAFMSVSLTTMGLLSFKLPMNFQNICRKFTYSNQSQTNSDFDWLGNTTYYQMLNRTGFSSTASIMKTMFNITTITATRLSGINNANVWNMKPFLILDNISGINHVEYPIVPDAFKWLSLASLLVYITAFSIGLGPMGWLVLSEIFPVGIKGRAMVLALSVNWGLNLLISLTFLTMTESLGLPCMLFIYAAMSLMSLVFVILFVPETKGQSLELISKELTKR
ncbi:solute carrier family 2, facilitated glucose transporter member 12 [Latimeria chalumnae]|uniref:solute carrier family 2, facilitated glucose transporter member 12 n=1 Tax=Latimeria chalumnae TaxID=7897 RepID=UPI00313B6FC0